MENPAFIIGDVHGHYEPLRALLIKAGLMSSKDERLDPSVTIIQLGDLGHFGYESSTSDLACYKLASKLRMHVLWGNHDRANFDFRHSFSGFRKANFETLEIIRSIHPTFALESHGYVLTHAGIHPTYESFLPPTLSPRECATKINSVRAIVTGLTDDIGPRRGGSSTNGGILWRDDSEELSSAFPQIYGHTRGFIRKHGRSYCIDIANRGTNNLAGIWLPSMEILTVGDEANIYQLVEEVA